MDIPIETDEEYAKSYKKTLSEGNDATLLEHYHMFASAKENGQDTFARLDLSLKLITEECNRRNLLPKET